MHYKTLSLRALRTFTTTLQHRTLTTMAPKIKLTYFDLKGRAEPIRLTFVAGGVEFEDERIGRDQFVEMKTSGALTFGSVPVLEVDDVMYGESAAQLRYAANVGGLAPSCPVEALKVDMVIDASESIIVTAFADTSAEGRAKFLETSLPRYFAPIEACIAQTEGPFLLGDKISAADIKLAVIVGSLKSGILDHIPTDCVDKYPAISGVYTAVMENERIKKYYASK